MSNVVAASDTEQVIVAHVPDFGKGRYMNFQKELYSDAKRMFAVDNLKAEKLAKQIASEVGAYMAKAEVQVKLGKINVKSSTLTISEAAKIKGIVLTNAIFALKAIQYANDAGRNGIGDVDWTFCEEVADYIKSL